MREAHHVNNQQIYIIPQDLSDIEILNHKQNANKGTFICPYCKAKLKVRSGPVLGNYFAHLHGEGCELSKQSEARSRKYEQLKKDDTPRHPQILAIIYDELNVLSKVYPYLSCSIGYLDPAFAKYIPDISLKINDHKYAITVFTNINSSTDSARAKNIQNQRDYYNSLGYEPLFFIERNNLAVDIDRESLVLWNTEREALSTQNADLDWQTFLSGLSTSTELQEILNIPYEKLNVKSIMYITPANQEIAIETFHVIEQPNTSPFKAYFLNKPYKLTFSQAFKLTNDSLTLANVAIEKEQQTKFAEKFKQMKKAYLEQQRQIELEKKERERMEKLETEKRKKIVEERRRNYKEISIPTRYQQADKKTQLEILKGIYNANN